MSDLKNIFADGLARVTVRGGVVRLTFGTQEEKQEGETEMTPSLQVIMPMDGFLNAFNVMQGIVAKMEKDGLVKKVENQSKNVIEAN
jgi:hypothetical protein